MLLGIVNVHAAKLLKHRQDILEVMKLSPVAVDRITIVHVITPILVA